MLTPNSCVYGGGGCPGNGFRCGFCDVGERVWLTSLGLHAVFLAGTIGGLNLQPHTREEKDSPQRRGTDTGVVETRTYLA